MKNPHIQMFALVIAAGCAASPAWPPAQFANAPVVHRVDDRRNVPVPPAERPINLNFYNYNGVVLRPLTRAMELPPPQRALGVNALDEVPDSTWFTNRIGVRDLTLDEVRTGPAQVGSPELHRPWTVHSTKPGAPELGLFITDARGIKFLLKFDLPGYTEQETSAHVIVGKLLWACGYNVTDDYVVTFTPDDLVLARDAVDEDVFGGEYPLDRAKLDEMLRGTPGAPGGRLRAMASRWIPGKLLGGIPSEGVREDDPNDRIPHEFRRDLRGAYSIVAWLDHVDMQEGNFVDTWIEDGGHHYVEHYMIDFGKALGVMNTTKLNVRPGFEYDVDFGAMGHWLGTLGIVRRPWEDQSSPPLLGVGLFNVDHFDPDGWYPGTQAYLPLLLADRFDKFWGAKILIRLSPEQIRAAVEAGRLSDPRATDYVTRTLVARQQATARYWFDRVNPADHFAIAPHDGGAELCFDDLALVHRVGANAATTQYRLTSYDRAGEAFGSAATFRPIGTGAAGHVCMGPLTLATAGDRYTIFRVETMRADVTLATLVYVALDPRTGAPRVIGIYRL
jgi:hypothetical protein